MAQSPESVFTRKLLAALKRHPAMREALIWKVSDRFAAGRPDLQIFLNGVTTYFEIKVAPYKLTKLQEWTLKKFSSQGYIVTTRGKYISIMNMVGYWAPDCTFGFAIEEIVRACHKLILLR